MCFLTGNQCWANSSHWSCFLFILMQQQLLYNISAKGKSLLKRSLDFDGSHRVSVFLIYVIEATRNLSAISRSILWCLYEILVTYKVGTTSGLSCRKSVVGYTVSMTSVLISNLITNLPLASNFNLISNLVTIASI